MQNLKYLTSYIVPVLAWLAIYQGGIYVWFPLIFAFVLIPILEPFVKTSESNYSETEVSERLSNQFFDWLLYLNLPIIYIILGFFIYNSLQGQYSTIETIGLMLSLGTLLGSSGINVAHELGHRKTKTEQFLAKALLLPSLYMHFFIEHNRGHHKNIATLEDPASARFHENLYGFWYRSITTGFISAWNLESKRLKSESKIVVSLQNEMIVFLIIELLYLSIIALISLPIMFYMLGIAIFSFLLLETINYVEHYGLQRKKNEHGRYERVQAWHSWNSNHHLGRIILYELTRHSDHHFISHKKYQILEHHKESPQLPFGYPTSMLMSMIPPLWFKIMNKEVMKYQEKELDKTLA